MLYGIHASMIDKLIDDISKIIDERNADLELMQQLKSREKI
jgi:hypothetical protein